MSPRSRFALFRGDVRSSSRRHKWRAVPRAFLLRMVRGYGGEHCQDCGCAMPLKWWAPTPLWCELVHPGGGGLFCPRCFDKRAEKAGIWLNWTPMVGARRDGEGALTPTTNWWLSDTRDWLMMGWLDPDCWERDRDDNGIYPTQWPWQAIKDEFADLMAPSMNTWGKRERAATGMSSGESGDRP